MFLQGHSEKLQSWFKLEASPLSTWTLFARGEPPVRGTECGWDLPSFLPPQHWDPASLPALHTLAMASVVSQVCTVVFWTTLPFLIHLDSSLTFKTSLDISPVSVPSFLSFIIGRLGGTAVRKKSQTIQWNLLKNGLRASLCCSVGYPGTSSIQMSKLWGQMTY